MSYKRNSTRYSKKKKKQFKKLNKKKLAKFIRYYRENPYKFAEDFCGVRLLPYQKILLKMMDNKYYRIIERRINNYEV